MNRARNRKILYLLTMVVLFTILSPFTPFSLGKFLEQQADRYELAQKSVGEIDPVSGTANLVFVGLRGVAVTFLWNEAIELKRKERWFEILPVLELITVMQPNFVHPWTFQSWNMAYNIAVEWEAVEDKYYWIKEGIRYNKRATEINYDKPDVVWYVGWLYYNRFGMSDEKYFLRDLFREDPDAEFTYAREPIAPRLKDSYHCAFDWFVDANEVVLNDGGEPNLPKQKGVTPFMSYPAVTRSYYADMVGQEGIFGESTRDAWRASHEEWKNYGLLGDYQGMREDPIHRLEFSPEEWQTLTEDEQYWVDHYRKIVNYNYWKARTDAEGNWQVSVQGPQLASLPALQELKQQKLRENFPYYTMQDARQSFHEAEEARKNGDYGVAIPAYEEAFPIWRRCLEENEYLRNDINLFQEDSLKYESRYLRLIALDDEREVPDRRPFEGLFESDRVQSLIDE